MGEEASSSGSKRKMKMELATLLILIATVGKTTAQSTVISTSTGAYFREIKNTHIYVQTLPIVYTISTAVDYDTTKIREQLLQTERFQQGTGWVITPIYKTISILDNLDEMQQMNKKLL